MHSYNEPEKKIERDLSVIYLHGFASGPKSSKAIYFADRLRARGIDTVVPDLNQPNFQQMTLTSQLKEVERTIGQTPRNKRLVIIGSSMGGLLATLKACEVKNFAGLILLAPGFGLRKRWTELIGEQNLKLWKESGTLDVFNYAVGKKVPLNYKFFEDIDKYETDELRVKIPTIIFHGKLDETVPIEESKSFALRNQDYVQLHQIDDDHQLISSLPYMWKNSESFLSSL